ncbi:hypothetical protein CAOG_07417 [Capsaspora owczarzaki ATCC 30864]|uniref:Condensin complex subunit 2 n=1 Tax=Capsaspora owczarzaki (strain ATCC 30864) TaxID=595528 RepID=A0A0D2X5C8_CAPO3|nr:hypothetical protein CAOG_07417 [Capsaspora owczarzaki ATCC 30864]KJE97584.1 hypothetical protein CAOG_007417 [Capsaspora owczarzaki ATCC 30864]|eukprot:XP_004343276.1 hypothetical protein CAOG_07417 [Capsaspora owczarzaki ATCC 30864]
MASRVAAAQQSQQLQQQTEAQQPASMSSHRVADLYSNCIKLSSENKITQKNSWELPLIDYITAVLESQNDGEMTNFQAASCTLDASIKIYSYRVDSIHTETYKVLGGLTRSSATAEETEEGDGTKARKAHRSVNTLETNAAALNVKTFDMEFDVDPLFTKTSASFDEGGAKGLLLNHLSVRNACELIFDSSDCVDGRGDEAETETENRSPNSTIDISDLKAYIAADKDFDSREICSAFTKFEFRGWVPGDAVGGLDALQGADRAGDTDFLAEDLPTRPMPDDDRNDGYADGYDNDEDDFTNFSDAEDVYSEVGQIFAAHQFMNGTDAASTAGSIMVSADSTDGDSLSVSSAGVSGRPNTRATLALTIGNDNEYSYFDASALKSWTGNNHWKLKTTPKDDAASIASDSSKKKKSRKEAFLIDFSSTKKVDWAVALGKSRAATTLSKPTVDKLTTAATTLPDDVHYTVDKLSRLFLKPTVLVKWNAAAKSAASNVPTNDDQVHENDYDQHHDNDDDDDYYGDDGPSYDDAKDDGHMLNSSAGNVTNNTTFGLFNTSMTADETFIAGEGLIDQPRRVEKISISYAKAAKRVDVRRLKETMWSRLEKEAHVVDKPTKTQESDEMPVQSFSSLFGELAAPYQQQLKTQTLQQQANSSSGLSVAICFVCLLHLANEKNLAIDSQLDMADLMVAR